MAVGIGICFKNKSEIVKDTKRIRVAIARILEDKDPQEMEEALASIYIQMGNLEDLTKKL